MCIFTGNFVLIFFLGSYALFELRNLAKVKDTTETVRQSNSSKPLNRFSCNFVVMKDIMCRCAYQQEIFIQFFLSKLRPS